MWVDNGPQQGRWMLTSWARVIAGPERSVVEEDLEHLEKIDGLYGDYRWGTRRAYRMCERTILISPTS